MKTKMTTLLCCMIFSIAVFAKGETKTDSFKVYGNCGMCKETIESALKKKDGILSKNWDKEKQEITVTYDPAKISVQKIGEKIASVGYDNQYATAKNESYNNLHKCCQYERPKK